MERESGSADVDVSSEALVETDSWSDEMWLDEDSCSDWVEAASDVDWVGAGPDSDED